MAFISTIWNSQLAVLLFEYLEEPIRHPLASVLWRSQLATQWMVCRHQSSSYYLYHFSIFGFSSSLTCQGVYIFLFLLFGVCRTWIFAFMNLEFVFFWKFPACISFALFSFLWHVAPFCCILCVS